MKKTKKYVSFKNFSFQGQKHHFAGKIFPDPTKNDVIEKWKVENATVLRPVGLLELPALTRGRSGLRFFTVPITEAIKEQFFSDTNWKRKTEWLEWSGSSCTTTAGTFQSVDRFRKCSVVINGQNYCTGNNTEIIYTTKNCCTYF